MRACVVHCGRFARNSDGCAVKKRFSPRRADSRNVKQTIYFDVSPFLIEINVVILSQMQITICPDKFA